MLQPPEMMLSKNGEMVTRWCGPQSGFGAPKKLGEMQASLISAFRASGISFVSATAPKPRPKQQGNDPPDNSGLEPCV